MVPWMSGLVSGLQNRVRRFESARNLKVEIQMKSEWLHTIRSFLYFTEKQFFAKSCLSKLPIKTKRFISAFYKDCSKNLEKTKLWLLLKLIKRRAM